MLGSRLKAERFLWTVATVATESVSITEYRFNGHNRTDGVCLAMFFVALKRLAFASAVT